MTRGVVPALMWLVWMLRAGSAPSSTQAVWREAAFLGVGCGEEERQFMEEVGTNPQIQRFASRRFYHPHSMQRDSYHHQWKSEQRPKGWAGRGNMLFSSVTWMWSRKSWVLGGAGVVMLPGSCGWCRQSPFFMPHKTKTATPGAELGKFICLTLRMQLLTGCSCW